jgi:hypothetical protein
MASRSKADRLRRLVHAYAAARQRVISCGFLAEIAWQESRDIQAVSETEFLKQFSWVVLAAGFRDSVVRQKYPAICRAFLDFSSARQIAFHEVKCRTAAMAAFGNQRKIDAILATAKRVATEGFARTKSRLASGDVSYLQTFPFMGAATSYHLAKNLGMDVVKPDRHLLRITCAAGYESPEAMCEEISVTVGERVAVVDLVLWRYATLNRAYLNDFTGLALGNARTAQVPRAA